MEERGAGRRARSALPVIAVALVTILVAAFLYLRPALPSTAQPRVATNGPTAFTLDPSYQVSYDFVAPSVGWAAIVRTAPAGVEYWIFVTADGARHWQVLSWGSMDRADATVELHMFDRAHGYVVVARRHMEATSDGANWDLMPLPAAHEVELAFADPRHGWFTGTVDGTPAGNVAFFATSDGGANWAPLPAAPGGGFAFRNASEGWAAVSTDSGGIVYSTHDGGLSWTAHQLPHDNSGEGKGVGNTGVRLLPGRGILATVGTLVVSSFDGGQTWRRVNVPAEAAFNDIAFQDATHWWVMPSGNLFKTADGGQTWTHVSLQFDDWQYRLQVVDAQHAWARLDLSVGTQDPTRGTALAFTNDGGRHWDYAHVPHPTPGVI